MKMIHKSAVLSIILSLAFLSCQSTPKNEKLNPHAFQAKIKELKDEQLVDVRTPQEYKEGHIVGATNINWNDTRFEELASQLDKSKPIMVYCLAGGRSGAAAAALKRMGFTEVYDLQGGMRNWRAAGLKESTDNQPIAGMSMSDYHKLVNNDKLVVVDFYATWCTPCKKMDPFLKEIAKEQADVMVLQKINADKNTVVAQELNITGLPTLLFYKNGKLVDTYIGYIGKEDLLKKIAAHN